MRQETIRHLTSDGKQNPLGTNRGTHKIVAANKIMYAERGATKRAKLKSQNAYRAAIGLPPIEGAT